MQKGQQWKADEVWKGLWLGGRFLDVSVMLKNVFKMLQQWQRMDFSFFFSPLSFFPQPRPESFLMAA